MNKTTRYNFIETDESNYRFLIVDDEADVMDIIVTALKKRYKKAHIFTATDGLQAIIKFRNSPPTVLITDLSMPKFSGSELLTNILNQHQDHQLSIVVISGLPREERYIDEILNGRFRFLPKPFHAKELLALVDNILKNPPPIEQKFKLNANFLSSFLLGTIKYFEKKWGEKMEKMPPFIPKANHISGDISFCSTFHTKNFQGFLAICFTEESCLAIQKKLGAPNDSIQQGKMLTVVDETRESICDELLAIGFCIPLDEEENITHKLKHRVTAPFPGNTIVLPIKSENWKMQIELTIHQ